MTNTTDNTTLIEFPCDFTIKIIGLSSPNFVEEVTNIVLKHYPETPSTNIGSKKSEQGNYTSISAVVYTHDKPSLDSLYRELTQYPDIKMVL